jgi:hypothetical protein
MVTSEDRQSSGINGLNSSDEVLTAAVVGTWVEEYPQLGGGGETTFFLDGHAAATIRADSPGLVPSEGQIRGTWEIKQGRLITKVVRTTPPGILPVGHTSNCRIESLTVEELILVTEDNTRLVERRRPNPPEEHMEAWETDPTEWSSQQPPTKDRTSSLPI